MFTQSEWLLHRGHGTLHYTAEEQTGLFVGWQPIVGPKTTLPNLQVSDLVVLEKQLLQARLLMTSI